MTEHLCLACQKPIVGKLREGNARIARRKYCSRACHVSLRGKQSVEIKACPVCSKQIERRSYESPAQYEKRVTCSKVCAGRRKRESMTGAQRPPKQKRARPAPPPRGYCQHCRKLLAAKKPNEAYASYAKRKFCSAKCAHVARTIESRRRWNARFEPAQPNIRQTVPAATEAEWLRLNNGPTACPVRFCAPVEHTLQIYTKAGRARYVP